MPFYSVVVHGTGIDLGSASELGKVVGFYANRIVRATSAKEAGEVAKRMIAAKWQREPYLSSNRGAKPKLEIDKVSESTFWRWLWFKNTGHTFYPEADAPDGEA